MSKKDYKLSQILDITPMDISKSTNVATKSVIITDDEKEMKDIMQTQKDIISLGVDSMEELIMIAKSTESPRAFEVVAAFLKNISDANKGMVDIINEKNKKNEKEAPQVVNNNLYVGKASDLFQKIKDNISDDN